MTANKDEVILPQFTNSRFQASKADTIAQLVYVEIASSESEIDDDVPLYEYHPLSGTDTIRILELHSDGAKSIECSLKVIGVFEGGYQALSYVWGSEEKPARALVRDAGGKTLGYIPLTANVYQTLQDLRGARQLTSQIFWIDQICIDQTGEEKNKQVALMGEIYRSAESVIFYAGRSRDEQSETRGIELLHRLDQHFRPNYPGIYESSNLYTAYQKASMLPVQAMPLDISQNISDHMSEFKWLAEVGYGEWRQRLWMVQEQLLNKNLVLLRGTRILSWDSLAVMSFLFFLKFIPRSYVFDFWEKPHGSPAVRPSLKWRSPWDMASSVFSVWHPRYGAAQGDAPRTLLQNIYVYEHLECRDVRDRIYAVLAISSDVDKLDITPNYQDNPRSIFHQLSIKLLSTYDNLEPLYVASCWDNLSDLTASSWALHQPFSSRLRPHFVPDTPLNLAHPRNSFEELAKPRFEKSHSVLVLRGRHIDKVALATPRLFLEKSAHLGVCDSITAEDFTKLLNSCSEILLRVGPTLQNTCNLGRVLIQWLPVANEARSDVEEIAYHFWCYFRHINKSIRTFYEDNEDTTGNGAARSANWKTWEQLVATIAELLVEVKVLDPAWSLSPDFSKEPEVQENIIQWPSRMYIHGRSLGSTQDGRICNVMNEVKDDDVITALQGWGRGFFVLRPVPGGEHNFRVVGEAWVSGLMEGQAYEGLDPAEVDYDINLV